MVQTIHGGDNSEMLANIIQTAQRRFGIYGMDKTTMAEIAGDLDMSKGTLYYYFPDKKNLYMAVVEKEQEEFLKMLEIKLNSLDDPEEMLTEYVKTRTLYYKSLLNLSRFSLENFLGIKPFMEKNRFQFREKEKEIVSMIFLKGFAKGIFSDHATQETAELFLDLLRGLSAELIKKKKMFYLEPEEFMILEKKAFLFTGLFIKGLKYR